MTVYTTHCTSQGPQDTIVDLIQNLAFLLLNRNIGHKEDTVFHKTAWQNRLMSEIKSE